MLNSVLKTLTLVALAMPARVPAAIITREIELHSVAGRHKILAISSPAAPPVTTAFSHFGNASDNNANPDPSPLLEYLAGGDVKVFSDLGWLKGEPSMDISSFKDLPILELWDWKTSPYGLDYLEVMMKKVE